MWHDNTPSQTAVRELQTPIRTPHRVEVKEPKEFKTTKLKFAIIILALCLFCYFLFMFVTDTIYEKARFNLLNALGHEQPEKSENFFIAISEYHNLIHSTTSSIDAN